jgi:hypothetical protein
MLDTPLPRLMGSVATLLFWRRGDRPWVVVLKGVLVSLIATMSIRRRR